jgi:hypothetical protein
MITPQLKTLLSDIISYEIYFATVLIDTMSDSHLIGYNGFKRFFRYMVRDKIEHAIRMKNKIVDYNPYVQKSTKVELIKLIDVTVFTPSKYPIITLGAIDRDYGTIKPTRPDGTNINYSDTSIQWGGLNTFISADSERVFLTNCENVQVIGVSDFVGVGLKDITIDSSYSGKTIVGGGTSNVTTVNVATYSATENDTILDVTYNDCVIDLDSIVSIVGKEITIKNSSTKTIKIETNQSPVYLIDGYESITINRYDSITLVNTGTKFIIV